MKRAMASAFLVAVLILAGAPADTREARTADGCQALENSVFRAVLAAGSGRHGPAMRPSAGAARTLVCAGTARAASSGFTKALAQRHVFLSWKSPDQERGDLCLSADLSQCYPNRNPLVPMSAGDAAFVADSWHAVRRAIGKATSGGHTGDVVRFAFPGLASHLDAELGRTPRGRGPQAYHLPWPGARPRPAPPAEGL